MFWCCRQQTIKVFKLKFHFRNRFGNNLWDNWKSYVWLSRGTSHVGPTIVFRMIACSMHPMALFNGSGGMHPMALFNGSGDMHPLALFNGSGDMHPLALFNGSSGMHPMALFNGSSGMHPLALFNGSGGIHPLLSICSWWHTCINVHCSSIVGLPQNYQFTNVFLRMEIK